MLRGYRLFITAKYRVNSTPHLLPFHGAVSNLVLPDEDMLGLTEKTVFPELLYPGYFVGTLPCCMKNPFTETHQALSRLAVVIISNI